MNDRSIYPCGRISRRKFLFQAGAGFFGTAMGALWAEEGKLKGPPMIPHHSARAKSVIFLFMCGGVSHIDTFDPKDNKWAGSLIDAVGFGDNLAEMRRPVIPCKRTFRNYGKSGIPVSDWFPHVGSVIDEIAVARSMWCHETNHFPAVIETATGHRNRIVEHPCLGSWVTYALGTENRNLPAFVHIGRPSSPVQLSGGYLGAAVSATPFQPGDLPIRNLYPPKGTSAAERERQMRALEDLNREFRQHYEIHNALAARTKASELAARMQLSAPEAVDFSAEPDFIKKLYGIGEKETDDFGKQLLLARRLVERGVRFIQLCHAGGGNGAWDAHGDMESHAPLCRQTDQPMAGLIRDLKQRGLLDSTLVVWTSEFGRTPWSQNTTGRDHNPKGFTSWLAGGGVRGGTVFGRTDDVGYRAVENPVYISDLQATILQQMGLDYKKMEVEINGRPVRLVEEGAKVIWGILG
ncbi:MAG: DUF1501 domain-containing protein [Verrucomicrobiales bacterium]|nr:DUF1501 domain-containing protein [Verrucomicrobiales bacterium]